MNEVNTVRVAVVGCGRHGSAMAQAVIRSDTLRLVGCVDPNIQAAEETARMGDARAYATLEDALTQTHCDAVLIATPHDQLAPAALEAIQAGKHLLIEKPMALNEAQAREIELAADRAGVTCMVGYSFRFGMARHVHELVTQGAIGKLHAITGSIGTGRMDEGWRADPATGGGSLLYVGCHLIDLALWLIGDEPIDVSATVHHRDDRGTDDTSSIHLDFGGGRLAQFLVTQSAHRFFYDLRVIGRDGSITLRGNNFVQYEIEVNSDVLPAYEEPTTIRPSVQGDHIDMMLMPELAEFADAVLTRRAPAVTATDGRRVLRLLDAIHNSSRHTHPSTGEATASLRGAGSQLDQRDKALSANG
jgi:predicted dehydrogenase